MAASSSIAVDSLGPIKKVIIDWVSASDGSCVITLPKITGWLIKAITDPSSTAPTDNWDAVITDGEGVNVLAGCDDDLLDRDTTNSEEVYFLVKDHAAGTPLAQSLHPVVCDILTVTIANAGDSKGGQIILFLEGQVA